MWRIYHIFLSICRKWQCRTYVGKDCVRNVLDTNNITCIRFTTVQCLIVINVPLKVPKVPSANHVFILISIGKIFTVNSNILINIVIIIIVIIIVNGSSLINIVVIVIIVIIIITIGMNITILYMCRILILSIQNRNLYACGCLLDILLPDYTQL